MTLDGGPEYVLLQEILTGSKGVHPGVVRIAIDLQESGGKYLGCTMAFARKKVFQIFLPKKQELLRAFQLPTFNNFIFG